MIDGSGTLAQTLFGVSRGFEPQELEDIRTYLTAAWMAQCGQPLSTLSTDLDRLDDLFRPHVQAKKLRAAAEQLPAIAARRPLLSSTVFVAVDDVHGFVTPEGRVLLEHLQRGRSDAEHVLTREALLEATAVVADFYGSRQRQWMSKELSGGDVRLGTLGFAVFLLINNTISRNRALLLPSDQNEEAALAVRVLPVISAFAEGVGGNPVTPRERERLRSNWIITEAKRQMGQFITRVDNKDDGTVRFWVEPSREQSLVTEVSRLLRARRNAVPADTLRRALEQALSAYELARPTLTSWGLAHERARHTREVFDALAAAYATAPASP